MAAPAPDPAVEVLVVPQTPPDPDPPPDPDFHDTVAALVPQPPAGTDAVAWEGDLLDKLPQANTALLANAFNRPLRNLSKAKQLLARLTQLCRRRQGFAPLVDVFADYVKFQLTLDRGGATSLVQVGTRAVVTFSEFLQWINKPWITMSIAGERPPPAEWPAGANSALVFPSPGTPNEKKDIEKRVFRLCGNHDDYSPAVNIFADWVVVGLQDDAAVEPNLLAQIHSQFPTNACVLAFDCTSAALENWVNEVPVSCPCVCRPRFPNLGYLGLFVYRAPVYEE